METDNNEISVKCVWHENGKWMADDDGSVFEFDTEQEALAFLDRSECEIFFSDSYAD